MTWWCPFDEVLEFEEAASLAVDVFGRGDEEHPDRRVANQLCTASGASFDDDMNFYLDMLIGNPQYLHHMLLKDKRVEVPGIEMKTEISGMQCKRMHPALHRLELCLRTVVGCFVSTLCFNADT